MRNTCFVCCLILLGCISMSCSRDGIVAEGGDFVLTIEDLRHEIRNLGPSASYDGSYEDRLGVVHSLATRSYIADEASRLGYGADEVAEVEAEARRAALAEAYRTWKIDNNVFTPRIESKRWITKLDRKLYLKEMVFAAYPAAEDVLGMLREGNEFDTLAETLGDRPDVTVNDVGWKIWKDLARDVANILFRLDRGEISDIIPGADGYHIFYLADDEHFGIGMELLALRSRRFVAAMETEKLMSEQREYLRDSYDVRFLDSGVGAGLEAFRVVFEGGRPPDSLVNKVVATRQAGEVIVADLYNRYFSLPIRSRPYLGDHHAVTEFAMDIMLPDLQALAGEDAGLGRLRDVQWAVKKAREEFLLPLMEDHFRSQIEIKEADMVDYYERHKDNIKTSGTYTARRIQLESRADVREFRKRIAAGMDFAEIARELSQDEYTAPRGGEMGEITFGMLAVYDSVVAGMKPGEVSAPFETEAGIEIIKLEAMNEPKMLTLEEAKPRMGTYISNARANELLTEWVNNKKREVGFRVNEDLLKRASVPEPEYRDPGRAITKTVDMSGEESDEEPGGESGEESGGESGEE
jgi:parvulin-like peptidyl-prolyl isomerase